MKFLWYKRGALMILTSFALTSCVSTDTLESQKEKQEAECIVLNLSAPAEGATRADDSHVLRYTAKLFTGSPSNLDKSSMQRQELIEGRKSVYGNENQIVFYLDPNTRYSIYVFADYIPKDKVADSGETPDYYYDTHIEDSYFRILTNPGVNNTEVSSEFFNNEHYDCFFGLVTDLKNDGKNEHNIILKRAVAKVRFIDNSNESGAYSVSGLKLKHSTQLGVSTGMAAAYGPSEIDMKGLSITDNSSYNPDNQGETELFYYYTFASQGVSSDTYNNLDFRLSDTNGSHIDFKVSDIQVRQNYVTTVRGKFLPSASDDGNGEDDDPSVSDDSRAIILNLSLDPTGWSQHSKDWSQD